MDKEEASMSLWPFGGPTGTIHSQVKGSSLTRTSLEAQIRGVNPSCSRLPNISSEQ